MKAFQTVVCSMKYHSLSPFLSSLFFFQVSFHEILQTMRMLTSMLEYFCISLLYPELDMLYCLHGQGSTQGLRCILGKSLAFVILPCEGHYSSVDLELIAHTPTLAPS